jgi:hypothetical protein
VLETDVHRGTDPVEQFRERVQGHWRRTLVQALTEPMNEEPDGNPEVPSAPIDRLAAHVVSVVWQQVEDLVRPIFQVPTEVGTRIEAFPETAPSLPSPAGVRPAVWLRAEEVAPVLQMTAHTLRRLARKGECPIVVRRIGGCWCFSRSDLERLVDTTR